VSPEANKKATREFVTLQVKTDTILIVAGLLGLLLLAIFGFRYVFLLAR
jgi:hypothetical protein